MILGLDGKRNPLKYHTNLMRESNRSEERDRLFACCDQQYLHTAVKLCVLRTPKERVIF